MVGFCIYSEFFNRCIEEQKSLIIDQLRQDTLKFKQICQVEDVSYSLLLGAQVDLFFALFCFFRRAVHFCYFASVPT